MSDDKNILIINPGSTSTKMGLYRSGRMLVNDSVKHPPEELRKFRTIWEQYDYRRASITRFLETHDCSMDQIGAIACRGGNVRPIPGGIYHICEDMIKDMKSGTYGKHPTNVGGLIAFDLGRQFDIPVFTLDPPMTDELCTPARYSGIPQIERQSSFHALNQKATARKISDEIRTPYEDLNMIVVHLGGGISVGAHRRGKIIDVNNALDGDGPFSPERAGSLPAGDLVKMCFSSQYQEDEILRLLTGGGGLFAYLGTTNAVEIERRIAEGDREAEEVFEAMAYQVSKEVGACAAVLEGEIDAIALTGSLVYSKVLMASLEKRISWIAPLYRNPGEDEMLALAEGVMRYLNGKEQLSDYN